MRPDDPKQSRAPLAGGKSSAERIHLLSIFPLARYGAFARVTCTALTESGQQMGEARIFQRASELRALLVLGFPTWEADRLLREVEAGEVTQLSIDDATARRLGFQHMLH